MSKNVIQLKSLAFGRRIVRMCSYLQNTKNEYILSKQLLRSGTAPGALVRESKYAESKKDFIHKLHIALKEANEAEYWILMLREGNYITEEESNSVREDCVELIKILTSIIKTSKSDNGSKSQIVNY